METASCQSAPVGVRSPSHQPTRERLELRLASFVTAFAPLLVVAWWLPCAALSGFETSSDSQIPYLMARHILQGDRPLFYWGQSCFGAVEAYLGAGLLWVFGADRSWLLNLIPLAFYAAAVAVMVRCQPPAVKTSLAVLLIAAPPLLLLPVCRPGFSQGSFLWLAWAAFLALRPGLDPRPRSCGAHARALLASLVLLLACFYAVNAVLAAAALFLALVVTVARERGAVDWTPRTVLRAAQAALAVAPAVVLLTVGEVAFGPAGSLGFVVPDARKLLLAGAALLQFSPLAPIGPNSMGAHLYYLGPFDGPLTLAAAGLALMVFLVPAAWGAWRVVRGEVEDPSVGPLYWLAIVGLTFVMFVAYPRVSGIEHSRYLTPVFIPVALLCAHGLLARSARARGLVLAGWVILALLGQAWSLSFAGRRFAVAEPPDSLDRLRAALATPGDEPDLALRRSAFNLGADLDAAVAFCRDSGVSVGYGLYWLAYDTTARSRETVTLLPLLGSSDRKPLLRMRARGATTVAVFAWPEVFPSPRSRQSVCGQLTVHLVDAPDLLPSALLTDRTEDYLSMHADVFGRAPTESELSAAVRELGPAVRPEALARARELSTERPFR
ncbi:MAG: hypothetical protein HY814_01725 [Candidatus Riflebacteria bacterium]|nr:hypothetical protein [Candidatus Riflebacteria bacterium]